jgi:hypothetical protein
MSDSRPRQDLEPGRTAFLFDLDGTLVDSVYQHVLVWREALSAVDIDIAVWTIHRRIGMSGGLMANAILRTPTYSFAGRKSLACRCSMRWLLATACAW